VRLASAGSADKQPLAIKVDSGVGFWLVCRPNRVRETEIVAPALG
jgi:hypothetical protein